MPQSLPRCPQAGRARGSSPRRGGITPSSTTLRSHENGNVSDPPTHRPCRFDLLGPRLRADARGARGERRVLPAPSGDVAGTLSRWAAPLGGGRAEGQGRRPPRALLRGLAGSFAAGRGGDRAAARPRRLGRDVGTHDARAGPRTTGARAGPRGLRPYPGPPGGHAPLGARPLSRRVSGFSGGEEGDPCRQLSGRGGCHPLRGGEPRSGGASLPPGQRGAPREGAAGAGAEDA